MCFSVKTGGAPPEQKSGIRNLQAFLIGKKLIQRKLHNDRRDRMLCV